MKAQEINNTISNRGLNARGDDFSMTIEYPPESWNEVPPLFQKALANEITLGTTLFLGGMRDQEIKYLFSQPASESIFFEGLLYSFPEATLMGKEKTSEIIKRFSNSFLRLNYLPGFNVMPNLRQTIDEKTGVVPFTFGKDSLLTYALMEELGFKLTPVFFEENVSETENREKNRLEKEFSKEFKVQIERIKIKSEGLRQTSGLWWGWDLLLTQYTLILIPLLLARHSRYLFWSNEQSCNDSVQDSEGYRLFPSFEQSSRWTQNLSNLLRLVKINNMVVSPVESLEDIAIMRILHHRYPKYGKYQMSCWADKGSKRWCGQCSKCGRMAVFLLGLGTGLEAVGLAKDMFSLNKKDLYPIFGQNSKNGSYDKSGLGRDEQLLGFLLAYQQGARGGLFDDFAEKYLPEATKREKELRRKYFSIYPRKTMPDKLASRVEKIFKKELEGFS